MFMKNMNMHCSIFNMKTVYTAPIYTENVVKIDNVLSKLITSRIQICAQ